MNVGDEIGVVVNGVPVVVPVLGCDELDPMMYESRWSCRVSLNGAPHVVVVCLWGGAVVDSSVPVLCA